MPVAAPQTALACCFIRVLRRWKFGPTSLLRSTLCGKLSKRTCMDNLHLIGISYTFRSSRSKEAQIDSGLTQRYKIEPPYVGCCDLGKSPSAKILLSRRAQYA